MKKNFLRVKQIVDQTVAGAEQSEAFTEDVQAAEKHVELLKQTCGITSKKIGSLLSKTEGNHEKRLKKITESAIGNTMLECGTTFGEKSIFKDLLIDCGQIGMKLGWEVLAHEVELEKQVVDPLSTVENEANNIAKARKSLSKLILDMDSARTRYRNAQKLANNPANVAKMNLIREELEEAQQKVDQNRDALAADIYTLLSREAEFAKVILKFAESQRNYHLAALKVLDENIPNLENKWRAHTQKPVFGYDLDDHLRTSGRTIAHPIEVCVIALHETAMDEEGVFRIAGGASKVRKFRAALDANVADLGFALELRDVHTVAGILKSYLRELPDPMLGSALYDDWISAIKIADVETRLGALNEVVRKLPEGRWQNTRYLMRFFNELSRRQDINKMTPQNLAIVLAPCLIWSPTTNDALTLNMTLTNMHSAIVEHLITFAERFFPGEIDYYATYSKSLYASLLVPPSPVNGGFTDRDEADSREVRRTHQRMGSNEGITDHRQSYLPAVPSTPDNSALGSPRPIVRKKNKPAPAVPEPPVISPLVKASPAKTPEKEERKLLEGIERPAEKPSLPPTGPDLKRISALPPAADKPKLAPRPSLNVTSHAPIGFESIENELRRHGSVKLNPVKRVPPPNKSDDEAAVELRKPSSHKRISSMDNVIANPIPHPNAVNVFGGLPPPISVDRTKLESEKQRPLVPGRPSLSKIQVAQMIESEVKPSDHSANKKNSLTLNSTDHPDIEFADSEDSTNRIQMETFKPERPPKPERPDKPERLSAPVTESNNNTTGSKSDSGDEESRVPRPAPRSSVPVPAVKPRSNNAPPGEVPDDDCTDF